MPRTVRILTLAALFLAATGAHAQMRDGMWEVTSKVDMPGMPQGVPPTTQRTCMRASDVQNPQKMMQGREDCKVIDNKTQGNRMTWRMECAGGTKGSGEMTFQRDSYEGAFNMTSSEAGKPVQMNVKYTGRRIGDCK
jgi:hypothetical protein